LCCLAQAYQSGIIWRHRMPKEQDLSQNIVQAVQATAKAYESVRLALQGDRVYQLGLIDDLLAAVAREMALRGMER
jgi:hypothetical protein